MSQLQNVLIELRGISKQVSVLAENGAWDILDEVLEMIRLFGEQINSNGVRTLEELSQLRVIKAENPLQFANIIFDNLQLLIREYEELVDKEQKNGIVSPFQYNGYNMALIKNYSEGHYFIHETDLEWEKLSKTIAKDTEAIIFVGYGAGMFQAQLLKNYHVSTIDPFDLPTEVKSEFTLSLTCSNHGRKELLQQKFQDLFGLKTEIIKHPLYENSTELLELLKLVRNSLSEMKIDLNTRVLYTESWYKQTFLNAIHIENNKDRVVNIDHLKDRYQGSHALMIAGGPSLEEAIPYLQQAQYAYYVIAIGQTVKVLLEHGIKPDFVVSIDAGEANAHFFKEVEVEVPLVYSLQVNHQIPQQAKGLLIPYADAVITQELLKYSQTSFTSFPTVALASVSFANHLGFDTIGLIGQDLALREGEYYSPSVKQVSSNDGQFHDTLYDVMLNNGQVGKTTPILSGFLSGYKSLFNMYPSLSKKLINYAHLGAVIDSLPYQPIETLQKKKISKQRLEDPNNVTIDIPIEYVRGLLDSISSRLGVMQKRLSRVINQKAVTVDEFEKMLRDWDAMIEAPSFRTHIMPLQLVNLLIIQNKIKFHNSYERTNAMRLIILSRMNQTIQELQIQLEQINNVHVETVK